MTARESVVRSSLWYGLEIVLTLIGGILSAIVVANHFGPERLREFLWVSWLANVSGILGTAGLPVTVQKYMAEYLGKKDLPTVLAIYRTAAKYQLFIGLTIVAGGWLLVALFMAPEHRLASYLLVGAIVPRILGFIPSQVNMAFGRWRANVPGSLAGSFSQIALTVGAVSLNLDLWTVALAQLTGYTLETTLKLASTRHYFTGVERGRLEADLRTRMIRFSTQGVGLLVLNLVVWDRSDIVFLKYLNSDRAQIAFLSQAFSLTEKLLMLPQIIGSPVSVALLGQAGRDKTRLQTMTTLAGLYLAVMSVPLLVGAAAVGPALWRLFYKPDWAPAIPVLVTMILLAIPRAFVYPAQQMLRAEERQDVLLKISCSAAVVNLTLDAVLVPGFGALGAALGNGTAQASAALATWFMLWRMYGLPLPLSQFGRLVLSSASMGLAAAAVAWNLPPALALPAGIVTGAVVFLLTLRWLRVLAPSDRERLLAATQGIPAAARPVFQRLLHLAIPAEAPVPTAGIATPGV